ncbi:MAG TPA: GMC family oxidoreductase [Aggregicoccus sp.]|nr:GMC family oxidoreductase [Aggregicoccus sp.]
MSCQDAGRIYTGDEVAQDLERSCDVCVVGSGAGGAVLAHALVERGLCVVMLEEGGYHTRREFDMREDHAFPRLYQDLGNRATDDLAITMLQGRSVGGGTTVNWCVCYRTPPKVLALWRDVHGVEGLSEQALAPHWEWLEQRLHIAEWPLAAANRNNRLLWEGLGALGYERHSLRRNVHQCLNTGYCGMGCPVDAKQGMLVTLLPEAVERGMTLFANARALRLETRGRRVEAVHAQLLDPGTDRPTGRRLTVRARVTALCAGAINSPALLLRSGLEGRGRVGKRTFLHPGIVSAGLFDEPVNAWYGAPMSVGSRQFAERGDDRLGYLMETPPVHPMLGAMAFSGFGLAHQEAMAQLAHVQSALVITRDGVAEGDEGGTVGLRDGGRRLSIQYPLHARNWEALRHAQTELARVQLAAGAREVRSLHAQPVVMRSVEDLPLLERAPWEPLRIKVFSAHQMGGCAMGSDPARSVVDSRLRYHDLDNLFVADGSTFPTSVGVNPQQTIFGLARWGAQHVASAVG